MTAIDDRQADSGDGTEHGHADEADDRQPEFPALNAIDPAEVGHFDQADRRGDDDGGQRGSRQVLQEIGRSDQQRGNAERADDAGQPGFLRRPLRPPGVRDELLLIGKPWKNPAARLAAPSPTISWLGST